jgi:hypothetical protein
MATQGMQLAQTGTGATRRIAAVTLVVVSLGVGALIGRSTSSTTKTETAVTSDIPISLTGWDTSDAARRAEVYRAVTAPVPLPSRGWETSDAARRALVNEIVTGS